MMRHLQRPAQAQPLACTRTGALRGAFPKEAQLEMVMPEK